MKKRFHVASPDFSPAERDGIGGLVAEVARLSADLPNAEILANSATAREKSGLAGTSRGFGRRDDGAS